MFMKFRYELGCCVLIAVLAGGCSDSSNTKGSSTDASVSASDASRSIDAAPGVPDARRTIDAERLPPDAASAATCSEEFIGAGDGCDCGCGVVDPDCPTPLSADKCEFDQCASGTDFDPIDPTQCIAVDVPSGWTCSLAQYDDDKCSCGCGAFDDKDCPAAARFSDCENDGCSGDTSPDPTNLTVCISDAPQDRWTCAPEFLLDGAQCDCGCGVVDPDCGTNPDVSDCDVVRCGRNEELLPGSISECREQCTPINGAVGDATCTNSSSFEIGSECKSTLSACDDGRRYEVECSGGSCSCRVDGQCIAIATGSGCSFSICGWTLVDGS